MKTNHRKIINSVLLIAFATATLSSMDAFGQRRTSPFTGFRRAPPKPPNPAAIDWRATSSRNGGQQYADETQVNTEPRSTGFEVYQRLVQSPERPSMADIRANLEPLKKELKDMIVARSASAPLAQNLQGWLTILNDSAPRLIAALEKAFPGQRYVFLGRDSAAIADIVEAFYLRMGQKNRVVRVGVSKATFASANGSPKALNDLLVSQGLDYRKIANFEQPGFVFVDTISKGYGTQGRELLNAVYTLAQADGIYTPDLLPKINFFGLVVSTFGNGTQHPFENAAAFLKSEQSRYKGLMESRATVRVRPTQPLDYLNEHQIITYPRQPNEASEAGYEHYTYAWHGSYGALTKTADGKTIAAPGAANGPPVLSSILWFQTGIWDAVNKDSFIASVNYEAMKLGYHFPTKPTERNDIEPFDFTKVGADALRVILSENDEVIGKEINHAIGDGALDDANVKTQLDYSKQSHFSRAGEAANLITYLTTFGMTRAAASALTLQQMARLRERSQISQQAVIEALAGAIPTESVAKDLFKIMTTPDRIMTELMRYSDPATADLLRLLIRYAEQNPEVFHVKPIDKKAELATLKKELLSTIQDFDQAEEAQDKVYYSENAEDLSQWLKVNLKNSVLDANDILLTFAPAVTTALRTEKINGKDARRLIAELLANGNAENEEYRAQLKKVIEADPDLLKILTQKAWSFLEGNKARRSEDVSTQFEYVRQHILNPMKCDLILKRPKSSRDTPPNFGGGVG